MYTPVKIHQLSAAQQRKLSKGDKVIIRQGSGQQIYLSEEQKKKFDRASQKGSGVTIQFDPYQQDDFCQSGDGIKEVFKRVAKIGQKKLRNKAKEAFERAKPMIRDRARKALPQITELAKSEGRRYLDRGVDRVSERISREIQEPVQRGYSENEDGEFEMEGEGFKEFVGKVKKAKIGKKLVGFVKDQKIGKRLSDAIVDRAIKTISGTGRPRGRPRKRQGGALKPAGY
jgi:hypothetical protein